MKEKICGIYCIENIINGKKYIGQSVNIYSRIIYHKSHLRRKDYSHEGYFFIKDWHLYGEENFKSYTIVRLPRIKWLLDLVEILLIFLLSSYYTKNGYNEAYGGKLGMKWRKHTKEAKNKMSCAKIGIEFSDYTKNKMSQSAKIRSQEGRHGMKGKHHTEESKNKISKSKSNPSDLTRNKMSESASGNKKVKNSSSDYVGVSWDKKNKKWIAAITFNGKYFHIGRFENEEDAALAYNQMAIELRGNFTKINIIKGVNDAENDI